MTMDARLKRNAEDPRGQTRAMDDRAFTEDRGMSDAEFYRLLSSEFVNVKLPKPPEGVLSGYHLCYLSTENRYDPLPNRFRMGYTPVKREEIPGWEHPPTVTGQYDGCIGINEMILCKIPIDRYRTLLEYVHHKLPLEAESDIKRETMKGKVVSEAEDPQLDAYASLGKATRGPNIDLN